MNQQAACMGPQTLDESSLAIAMLKYGKENARFVARNPKLLKATLDILRAVARSDGLAGTAALASGTSGMARAGGAGRDVQDGARFASAAIGTFKISMDMLNVARLTSVGAILGYLGAATVQKSGIAVSLVGTDSEGAKCAGAFMELAGAAGAAIALSPVTAPTGVLLALQLSSLAASAINAHLACRNVRLGF